jgi:hypothetical protein
MSDEMKAETVDMVVTAVEKHSGNYEVIMHFCDAYYISTSLTLKQAGYRFLHAEI